jgi:tripartite-type tricarboxylate transporter receptor subunit TctC
LVAEFDISLLTGEVRYPYVVQWEQYKLVHTALPYIKASGIGEVRFSTKLIDLAQTADYIEATVANAGGKAETPVAGLSRDPDVMVVNPTFPTKTVPEFISYAKSYAKANPSKLNMPSPGVGTSPHMAGELFKFMTGIEMTHVAYRGSAPALTDLLGGQVQVYFAPISASIEYIRTDKLRALAHGNTFCSIAERSNRGRFRTGL